MAIGRLFLGMALSLRGPELASTIVRREVFALPDRPRLGDGQSVPRKGREMVRVPGQDLRGAGLAGAAGDDRVVDATAADPPRRLLSKERPVLARRQGNAFF